MDKSMEEIFNYYHECKIGEESLISRKYFQETLYRKWGEFLIALPQGQRQNPDYTRGPDNDMASTVPRSEKSTLWSLQPSTGTQRWLKTSPLWPSNLIQW